jgi:fatty acid desaturase
MTELPVVDEDVRNQAVKRIKKKREFARHLVIFVLVNAGLWAIWAVNGAETDDMWPAIVTGIWAVFLVLDLFKIFERPITDQQIQDEVARLKRG